MTSTYPAETNDGTVTSYIPLVTSFASVPGCSNSFILEGTGLVAFDPQYGLNINTGVKCQPPAVTRWWNQALLGDDPSHHTAISLGPLQCPDSWNTLATSVVDTISTQALCCPPGYTLQDGTRGQAVGDCISELPAGASVTYASGSGTSWQLTVTVLSSQSTVGAIGVLGWNVNAASTSAAAATTSIATTSGTITNAKTTTPTPTSTSTSTFISTPTSTATHTATVPSTTSSSQTELGGLSHSATIGIAVGVSLGVLGLIALVTAICLLRRRKQSRSPQPRPASRPYEKTELDAVAYQNHSRYDFPVKSYDSAPHGAAEMDAKHQPSQSFTHPPPQYVYRPAHELHG